MSRRERAVVVGLLLALAAVKAVAAQQTIRVTAGGSVAAAIARAADDDTVMVSAGVYHEPTIVIDRRIALIGQGTAVLDADGTHQLVVVAADGVTIRSLTFRNVGVSYVEDRAAIRVAGASGCRIEQNRIENGFFGIYLAGVSNCHVVGNIITSRPSTEAGSGNGIHLWSSHDVVLADNRISGHRDGIYFEFVTSSEVRSNTSEGNLRYGLHFMYSDGCRYVGNTFRRNVAGVAVMYTKRVEMRQNRFEDNWGAASYGLLLKEVYDVDLTGNLFARNTVALLADGANRLHATGNAFRSNGWAVKVMASTIDGRFARNNFAGNTFDVSSNSREGSSRFVGNYWDRYSGYDANHDGIGDVPHRPVRLFSLIVERNEPSLILLKSFFVDVLDVAERLLPLLTPVSLSDEHPAMHPFPAPTLSRRPTS